MSKIIYLDDKPVEVPEDPGFEPDYEAMLEIHRRGTCKGSDYNVWEAYDEYLRAKYREKGWCFR